MPRRYRGRDIWCWLQALGQLDESRDDVPGLEVAKRAPSLPLSGSRGGEQLDLSVLRAAGVDVTGRLRGFVGRHALFGGELERDVQEAEQRLRRVLAAVDDHLRTTGIEAPDDEVPAFELPAAPASLDLRAAGVTSVIWATGYRRTYPWLHVPVLDGRGEIVQREGVTPAPGLYTLGLKFQRTRASHTIGGVGADAELLARLIVRESVAGLELLAA